MKPDWKDAPEWAKYLAQDNDGMWFWFELKPELMRDCWANNNGEYKSAIIKNWESTLEQHPSLINLDNLKSTRDKAEADYFNAKALGVDGDVLKRLLIAWSNSVADFFDAVQSQD